MYHLYLYPTHYYTERTKSENDDAINDAETLPRDTNDTQKMTFIHPYQLLPSTWPNGDFAHGIAWPPCRVDVAHPRVTHSDCRSWCSFDNVADSIF
jgi:hypothetical protein